MYAEVPFLVKVTGSTDDYNKRMKEFRKWAKEYLTPAKERGLNGYILGKARRVHTLRNLLTSQEGIALAKTFGVSFNAKDRLLASVDADIASLLEYAVAHKEGGLYYPNAILPWRGLLESEAYAHAPLQPVHHGKRLHGRDPAGGRRHPHLAHAAERDAEMG
jgi:hypothetical protein